MDYSRRPPAESDAELRPVSWIVRGTTLSLHKPLILGVLNVTPDSFSDGGEYLTIEQARARVRQMCDEGVDVVDIGGESTRPGSAPVEADEESRRILPVVRAIRREHPALPISIDTTKSAVAHDALSEGADIINDVSGMRLDPSMARVAGASGAGVIVMHSRGRAGELATYEHATYDGDVVGNVERELLESVARAAEGGVSSASIVIDPGVGFSKRSADSVEVLRALPRLTGLGFPLLVGASRKRMVGALMTRRNESESTPSTRLHGTVGVHVAALALGARLFRVHDVGAHRDALDAAWALLTPERPDEVPR